MSHCVFSPGCANVVVPLQDVTPTGIGALAYIGGVICIVFLLPTIVYLIVR